MLTVLSAREADGVGVGVVMVDVCDDAEELGLEVDSVAHELKVRETRAPMDAA